MSPAYADPSRTPRSLIAAELMLAIRDTTDSEILRPLLHTQFREVRERILHLLRELVADPTHPDWLGPELDNVNPPIWELGHLTWFAEEFALRGVGAQPPAKSSALSSDELKELFDSVGIPHGSRWTCALPSSTETLQSFERVWGSIEENLPTLTLDAQQRESVMLALFHAQMHAEAFMWWRQTFAKQGEDRLDDSASAAPMERAKAHSMAAVDLEFGGDEIALHVQQGERFTFDNERGFEVASVAPFKFASRPVTETEFADFVLDGGYDHDAWWSTRGLAWRQRIFPKPQGRMPLFWRRDGDSMETRVFHHWRPLNPMRPVVHINAFEAEAFCSWAGRRLPTEAEWRMVATVSNLEQAPPNEAAIDCTKIGRQPYQPAEFGEGSPTSARPAAMLGGVWEWTATPFAPFDGFEPGIYRDYSAPWFHSRRVLKGGCFATSRCLVDPRYRNYFAPDRRDVFAGFRTAADA